MPRGVTASTNGHGTAAPAVETIRKPRGKSPVATGETPDSTKGVMIEISPPNFGWMECQIVGEAPLMINRFAKKAELQKTHEAGRKARSKRDLPPRDFEADYQAAKYIDVKGKWEGLNAVSIRNAMIAACRTTGAKMTMMKMAVFVEAEGYDEDGTPLIRIHGDPVMDVRYARNSTGVVDLRSRPRYDEWHATVTLRYDADMIAKEDVANLIMRAGMQAGIGEGRPFSKESAGIGYGLFKVAGTFVVDNKDKVTADGHGS